MVTSVMGIYVITTAEKSSAATESFSKERCATTRIKFLATPAPMIVSFQSVEIKRFRSLSNVMMGILIQRMDAITAC